MSDIEATLRVVSGFLVVRGYDRQEKYEGVQNGRWIYDWCQEYMSKDICLSCVDEALRSMFMLMENGSYYDGRPMVPGDSEWTRACTNAALHAGGFPEWSEAGEKE